MSKMSNPVDALNERMKGGGLKHPLDSKEFADFMDQLDPLRKYRERFQFPTLGSMPCGEYK